MAAPRERKSVIADIISTNATPNSKEALVFTKMSEMGSNPHDLHLASIQNTTSDVMFLKR